MPQGLVYKLWLIHSPPFQMVSIHFLTFPVHTHKTGNWILTPFKCPFHSSETTKHTVFGKCSWVTGLEKTPFQQVFCWAYGDEVGEWNPWVIWVIQITCRLLSCFSFTWDCMYKKLLSNLYVLVCFGDAAPNKPNRPKFIL